MYRGRHSGPGIVLTCGKVWTCSCSNSSVWLARSVQAELLLEFRLQDPSSIDYYFGQVGFESWKVQLVLNCSFRCAWFATFLDLDSNSWEKANSPGERFEVKLSYQWRDGTPMPRAKNTYKSGVLNDWIDWPWPKCVPFRYVQSSGFVGELPFLAFEALAAADETSPWSGETFACAPCTESLPCLVSMIDWSNFQIIWNFHVMQFHSWSTTTVYLAFGQSLRRPLIIYKDSDSDVLFFERESTFVPVP